VIRDPNRTAPPEPSDDASEAPAPGRKERVLHTRVPAVLEQELKKLAHSWRVPVSNVVRAILEDAVAAVDVVGRRAEGNLHHVVDRLAEQRERLRTMTRSSEAGVGEPDRAPGEVAGGRDGVQREADPFDGIIGYQPLRLATKSKCSKCGRVMRAGEEAYLGVREGPGPRVLLGGECLPAADDEDHSTEDEP